MGRGAAYYRKGDNNRAIAELGEAIRLKPNEADSHYIRGLALQALQRREDAIANFRRALSISPNFQQAKEALTRLGASP